MKNTILKTAAAVHTHTHTHTINLKDNLKKNKDTCCFYVFFV